MQDLHAQSIKSVSFIASTQHSCFMLGLICFSHGQTMDN